MDRSEYIHKRKRKYMAQVLEDFEQRIEPHLPESAAKEVDGFKGLVRMRMNALATDAVDISSLGENGAQNEMGQEIRDRLHPAGRP